MWVRFCFDANTPQMSFRPGPDVEVPDRVVRRWELIWELFVLIGLEMDEWKARGFHTDTKALPSRHELAEPTGLEMNELVRRMAERERREAIQEVS